MIRFGKILINLFITAVIIISITLSWLNSEINSDGPLRADKLVQVKSGSSVRAISNKLAKEGVVSNHIIFMLVARVKNSKNPLKAGEYEFKINSSMNDVIAQLQNGITYQHKITIPEGLMSVEIVALLNEDGILNGDIIDIPVEGSMLPETYSFSRGDTKQSVINRMQSDMQKTIDELWEDRSTSTPVKTKEEAIILASIVEKETSVPAERPRVAGVFSNRLNRRIPLQTDPTVIYSITKGKRTLDRALIYKDLKTPSPYNTYMVQGLPPGPIANPGRESINAVLNPEYNEYIYFVADGTGGHAFAKTLKEHNNNVRAWRKFKKANK